MTRILFICLGNICRSPMAEFVMKDLVEKAGIAEKFEIGKTQLYEIAKKNYGIGIAEHIRFLRIEKAKRLLEDNNLPLAEIASLCGFKDYNYFITVFKRVVGISPKKYCLKH